MSSQFPNKTIFSISTSYQAAKTITAISNASPAIATAAANGYSDGDIILLGSGWPSLNDAPSRVDNPSTGSFTLEGYDTSNVSRFPAGAGVPATAKKVLTWSALSQVLEPSTEGGEQNYYEWVYLDDGLQRRRPTFKNARTMRIPMDYDKSLGWYAALVQADTRLVQHV